MVYEALRNGRKIDVVLQRNSGNDCAATDACYTGFDICWDDGAPAQVNLARMCGIAVNQIFGDQIPNSGSHRVQFYLVPVDDPCAPRLGVPRRLKPRRVYFERQGPAAALHLANGYCTDIVFHQDDDPRMLQWVGLSQLSNGQRQWVDMLAIYLGEGSAPSNAPTRTASGDRSPTHFCPPTTTPERFDLECGTVGLGDA